MDTLVIHKRTKAQLDAFVANPSHALLLTGAKGMGKQALAQAIISRILGLKSGQLKNHPHVLQIVPDERNTISIDAVRNIQKFLQLKTTGSTAFRRSVIIEAADSMSVEAQNAYLKLLEEPPADTILVLTAESKNALLTTILSRAQLVHVHAPSSEQLTTHFTTQGHSAQNIQQASTLSRNLPGLMQALLASDSGHPLLSGVQTAKKILSGKQFERLAAVDGLSKQKGEISQLLDALTRIAQSALEQAASKQDNARIRQWHAIRKEIAGAQSALQKGANAKLLLTKMFLHF